MARRVREWVVGVGALLLALAPWPALAQPRTTLDAAGTRVIAIANLSQDLDCPLAETVGRVVGQRVSPDGKTLQGITFEDQYGRGFINLDPLVPPADAQARAWLVRGVQDLLRPGQRLRLGVRGCGARGAVQSIDSIALAGAAALPPPAPTASPPPSQSAAGWSYGMHPVLGMSAHVAVGNGAIGVACGFAGSNRARVDAAAWRVTTSLIAAGSSPAETMLWVEGKAEGIGAAFSPVRGAGYVEHRERACMLDTLPQASAFLLVPGKYDSFETRGNSMVVTVLQGDRRVTVVDGQGIGGLSGVVRIPTAGAAQAFQRLINACVAIRDDLRCAD